MQYEKIGKFISECRKEKGYTQKELGEKIGLTDKAISKWERGLGCPDVSVLEPLSQHLGVSILEILKGEKINDEQILAGEAKEIVSNTVSYTKKKTLEMYKNTISKIISYIIVFIGIYLLFLNIFHILYLNKKFNFDFNNPTIIDIKNTIPKIDEKIETIKKNKGKYQKEDYDKIIELLDKSNNDYKNMEILKYSGIKKIGYNELYTIDITTPSSIEIMQIYDILKKYDKKINNYIEDYKQIFFLRGIAISLDSIDYKYKYQIYYFKNQNDEHYNLIVRILNCKYLINSYNELLNTIIEVGDIHE